MNTYFERNGKFDSNNRMIDAYFGEAVKVANPVAKAIDSILSLLFRLWQILCSATARRVIKASTVALSLVGLVGIIGAIESGSLALGMGLILGLGLIGIEYLCLRPRRA